jgi:hypothetical protein
MTIASIGSTIADAMISLPTARNLALLILGLFVSTFPAQGVRETL